MGFRPKRRGGVVIEINALRLCHGRHVGAERNFASHHIGEADGIEKRLGHLPKPAPQPVRQTRRFARTARIVFGAAGEMRVFIDGQHHRADADVARRARQAITARTAARALNQPGTAQTDKNLFKVGERQALALCDL